MSERDIEQAISEYFIDAIKSVRILYSNKLLGQTLIVIFSTIDAVGLLNAPKSQKRATGDTFKRWAKKYMLCHSQIEYSAVDLWASRCATLHTYTTASDLSNSGKAREILFYSGSPLDRKASEFAEFADNLSGKRYVTANIEVTIDAFCTGLKIFSRELDSKCRENEMYRKRLSQIIHAYTWQTSNN